MLFDSHTHLNFQAFDNSWREVIEDCLVHDIWLTNIGAQLATSQKAIEVAEEFPTGVYASVGLHPTHVPGSSSHPEEFDEVIYEQLIQSSTRVVALGETGIDFYHDEDNLENQEKVLRQHLELAQQHQLPVVLHGRNSKDGSKNAYEHIMRIVQEYSGVKGVAHCFGGSFEQAQQMVEFGFYVGITGIVTFKSATEMQRMATELPLERLLIETDAPYLAPEPYRGKENKPQYVHYVAEYIAQLRGINPSDIAEATFANTCQLYSVKSLDT